jgi:hypothetical protein
MPILGAYNRIDIDATCPACTKHTVVRCQTHVASSFAGDGTGRFCHREYRVGQTMAWWPRDHADHDSWSKDSRGVGDDWSCVDEACYSTCQSCAAELCVVIRFRELVIEAVMSVSRDEDWPESHPR